MKLFYLDSFPSPMRNGARQERRFSYVRRVKKPVPLAFYTSYSTSYVHLMPFLSFSSICFKVDLYAS